MTPSITPTKSPPTVPVQRMAINPLINQKLLEAAPNEAAKDQAQYFTPVLWAEILGWVLRNIPALQPFQPAKSLSRC